MRVLRARGAARVAIAVTLAAAAIGCSDDDDSGGSRASDSAGWSTGLEPSTELTAASVEASIPELHRIVETAMTETGVPGIATAVVFDDEVVDVAGFGVRDVATSEPIEPETVFQIASLSKPISSTIMAAAVGEGIVAWDDPVADHNPSFTLSERYVSDNVTFADLFAHRSGIPAGGGDVLESIGFDRDEILERLALLPLNPFRDSYGYSNFAMTAGGESAAIAAGESWEDLADRLLFEPAGMASTSMRHADYVAADNRAELHVDTGDGWSADFERTPDAQAPAGGVSSNVVDLAEWVRLQLAEGKVGDDQVIDSDALATTHTPTIVRSAPSVDGAADAEYYGLGWNVGIIADGTTRWNHSGAFSTGAATAATLLPEHGLGLVVLTNGQPIGVPEAISEAYLDYLRTGEWSEDVFAIWTERFGGIYGEPEYVGEPPEDGAPAKELDAYAGTYHNDYVDDVEVSVRDGELVMVQGPAEVEFTMTHWDGDTFVYVPAPELPWLLAGVDFEVVGDAATAMTVSEFDVGQERLVRI